MVYRSSDAQIVVMTTEETEIYEFLKRYPKQFVSVTDISQSVASRKTFNEDRLWAQPILRRMEMEGWVESDPFGDFRIKHLPEETTTFLQAIEMPGMSLGDTTIVSLSDTKDEQADVA